MFESYFQLARRPFAVAPEVEAYYPAESIEEARRTLVRSIERAEGVGLVIGTSGTGKSLLCQLLAQRFRDKLELAMLSGAQLATRRALLQAILFELNLPYRGMDEGELRLSLIDHLTRRSGDSPGVLLIVDEAQTLPQRLLEELRLITNVVRQGAPRVRLVLAGGPALEERFATPQLESFSQRIAARCYLQAFQHADTVAYVTHRMTTCGGDGNKTFSPEALDAIHRATDGIPRLINQLADHALVLGFTAGVKRLDAAAIEEAWADLQQLPMPWHETTGRRSEDRHDEAADVIEFGGLDDDDLEFAPPAATESDFASTVDHLAELEEHVDAMADEFRPAGSIRPEVEFVLPDLIRPRDETFDEEEVVLDRYAELDASSWSGLPQVSSREGRELSRLLERYSQTNTANRAVVRPAPKPDVQEVSHAAASSPRTLGSVVQTSTLQQPAATSPDVALTQLACVETSSSVDPDDDLIVVEDDADCSEVVIRRPIAPVRRQEYRQLFARLRHG